MPPNARRIIATTFLLSSIVFTVLAFYTTHVYVGVYRAVRVFDVAIQKFNVEVVNTSYILIQTILNIQNPSEYDFQILYIQERFRLDKQFVMTHGVYMEHAPLKIPPLSNVTVTIGRPSPSYLTQYIKEQMQKTWIVEISLAVRGLLIGRFMLNFYEVRQLPLTPIQQ